MPAKFRSAIVLTSLITVLTMSFQYDFPKSWESKFVQVDKEGELKYIPDEKRNIIPDFSQVGYYKGDRQIPNVPVVKTVEISGNENADAIIQAAIDEVSKRTPDKNGFRGTILLKKG